MKTFPTTLSFQNRNRSPITSCITITTWNGTSFTWNGTSFMWNGMEPTLLGMDSSLHGMEWNIVYIDQFPAS